MSDTKSSETPVDCPTEPALPETPEHNLCSAILGSASRGMMRVFHRCKKCHCMFETEFKKADPDSPPIIRKDVECKCGSIESVQYVP